MSILKPYTRRSAPAANPFLNPSGVASSLKAFLDTELANVQRGIPGSAAAALSPYAVVPGEVGVVDQRYAVGDIRRYGAISGGVWDCTTAYRNAVLSIPTGGVVLTPTGTWYVSGQVTVASDNVLFSFEPGAVVLGAIPGTDNAFIYAAGQDNIRVEHGTFTGAFPWAVFLSGGAGHRITDNTISGGTVASNGKCGGIYLEDCSDFIIARNRCSGNGDVTLDTGADIQGNNGATIVSDGWIVDNHCSSTLVCENIIILNPQSVMVRGNRCTGARVTADSAGIGGYGIALYHTDGVDPADVRDCLVIGNLVESVQGIGIYTQRIISGTIADNDVTDACTAMAEISLSVAGIVSESQNGLVANNRVTNSGKNGIIVSGFIAGGESDGQVVIGNIVRNPALDGIVINGAMNDITIADNYVESVPNGRLAYGSWHGNDMAITRCVIRGNVGRNVGLGAFLPASSVDCTIADNVFTGLHDTAYIALNQGTRAITRNNTGSDDVGGPIIQVPEGTSSDRGDTDVTLVSSVDFETQQFATALTANRTVTLSATNVSDGARFRIVRTGLGAFTLDVGGLKTIPSATAAFVDVAHDGSAWILTGYGTL